MAINEKKPLFVRIAGERQPNLLPVTASAVGFDFNRDRFVFYHTASDDWTDISPDGVEFVGSVYADNFFSAGVVTASLGFSGSLTQLTDGRSYLVAGTNVTITSESNGQVTISSTGGGGGGDVYWDSAQNGIIFTTGSALVGGYVTASLGFSGSLTQLADGTSYLIAGVGIDITSASNGPITISSLAMMQPEYWQSVVANEIFTTGSVKVAGFVTASLGFSGSLTKLADGSSYLIAGENIQITSQSNGPVTITGIHESLRDLIHFIDQGPACGFPSGYKEQGPAGPFPTQSVWYTDASKTNKIVELIVTWSGPVPSSNTWRAYRSDGVTVDCTVVDTFTYVNSIFEDTRTRVIT